MSAQKIWKKIFFLKIWKNQIFENFEKKSASQNYQNHLSLISISFCRINMKHGAKHISFSWTFKISKKFRYYCITTYSKMTRLHLVFQNFRFLLLFASHKLMKINSWWCSGQPENDTTLKFRKRRYLLHPDSYSYDA